jgi:hypothetical protein
VAERVGYYSSRPREAGAGEVFFVAHLTFRLPATSARYRQYVRR